MPGIRASALSSAKGEPVAHADNSSLRLSGYISCATGCGPRRAGDGGLGIENFLASGLACCRPAHGLLRFPTHAPALFRAAPEKLNDQRDNDHCGQRTGYTGGEIHFRIG